MKKYLLLLVQIFFTAQLAVAQGNELLFSSLTSENGLSNNTIHSMLQDHEGFMWIGTDDGLSRYDGYEFVVFRHNTFDSSSISSNTIFKILEDSQHRLWIAGSTGIDIYDRATMSFRQIPLMDKPDSLYYFSYTRAILENESHNIIIANTNGVYTYNEDEGIFERMFINVPSYGVTQQEGIRAMHIDKNHRIWIGSVGYGLFAYDLNEQKIVVSPQKNKSLHVSNRIFAITEDSNGDIWLGADEGIYIIRSDLSDIFPLQQKLMSDGVQIRNVMDIKLYEDNVWIGTDGQGLLQYNIKDGSVTQFQHNANNYQSLNNNSVRSILIDLQGFLWVATFYGGVNYALLNKTKQFSLLKNEVGNPNSPSYNVISAIYQDTRGDIWIGTDGGGLDHYTADYHKIKNYRFEPGYAFSINANSVLTIDEDSKGRIWIGGYQLGLNVIDPFSNKINSFRHNPNDPNSLSSDNVWDIYIDENDIVWIATNEGGLNRYDPQNGRFRHFLAGAENSIISNWSIKIYPDHLGNLWIGTYGGLSVFNPKEENFTNYASGNKTGGPGNNWIYSFAEDSIGNMWIGTANGLNYFRRKTQRFEVFDRIHGLPNEVINGILTDNHQNLWLSTNKGIAKFNPNDHKVWSYNKYDGLQGDQFIHGAYFKSSDGKMYFGGQNGLNYFFPDSIGMNNYKPPVHLTDLMLDFRRVEPGAKGSPLQKAISETETLILTHLQSTFTIKYTALNYINTKKNQFAYQLQPYDKDWNYVGYRKEATYTNLDPGTYKFKVIASNNDGVWNEEGTSLTIQILPAWWDTVIFKLAATLFIIFMVFIFYLLRIRNLKMQKIYLEREVENRTRIIKEKNSLLREQALQLNETNVLLEENQQQIEDQNEVLLEQKEELEAANKNLEELNSTKDRFFSIIAHDLKNPFGLIRGFAEIIRDKYSTLDDDKKKKYINTICDASSQVYNLLQNLLDWSQSQTDRITISPAPFALRDMLESNLELVAEMVKNKHLNTKLGVPKGIEVYADLNMINTVVRNLLTNAIKFSPANKTISISAQNLEDVTQVQIKDEGIGISEDNLKKLFRVDQNISRKGTNGESGTGLGLILCKEYIEKNGGEIRAESAVGKGSIFYFTLPLYSHSKN